MYRYKFIIAYDGTPYYGWQLQPQKDKPTVQGVLEQWIYSLFKKRIPFVASSRTDAGVHALGQVVHCKLPEYISTKQLFASAIQTLPDSISIRSIALVTEDFHSQKSLYKCYEYSLWTGKTKPLPFILPFVWHTHSVMLSLIEHAIPYIIGTRDYIMFKNYKSTETEAIRTLFALYPSYDTNYKEILRLTFWGNGFVRGMVRNLVGFLVAIGRGIIPIKDIPLLLQNKQRKHIPSQTAPAQGLTLQHVQYADHTILEQCSSL